MIAIGRAAGCIGKASHLCVACRDQHVEEAVDVGAVSGDRVVDRARDGAEGGLMQDVVHTFASLAAVVEVADVALDELEACPLFRADQLLDFVEVVLVAGGEVVEADHPLVELEQSFQQVGADEASYTGNQPGLGGLREVLQELFVAGHRLGCCLVLEVGLKRFTLAPGPGVRGAGRALPGDRQQAISYRRRSDSSALSRYLRS